MSEGKGVARGMGGRRPHRVGLLCPGNGENGAARLLLGDLAAATRAYERRAGMGDDALELIDLADGDAAGVDALVVALGDDVPPCDLPHDAQPGTLVYAVLACGSDATRLEAWCQERDLAWSGALVVRDATTLPATWASPRLGWLRRPVSEGVDALVLALRTGSDAGIVHVRPGLARRAWAALLARLFSARG